MIGPDFANEVNSFTEEFFWSLLTSTKKLGVIKLKDEMTLPVFSPGKSSGEIIGGNLAVISSMVGTNFSPDLRKKILFLEDVSEPPYKIDRMLNKLRLSGYFKKINGIILGSFIDCEETDSSKKTLTLGEVMNDYLKDLKIPVIYGFPHGHIKEKVTIPFGISVKMNAMKGYVEYRESAVR
jgi:muramoyltetrapeptide carboxypeptidase